MKDEQANVMRPSQHISNIHSPTPICRSVPTQARHPRSKWKSGHLENLCAPLWRQGVSPVSELPSLWDLQIIRKSQDFLLFNHYREKSVFHLISEVKSEFSWRGGGANLQTIVGGWFALCMYFTFHFKIEWINILLISLILQTDQHFYFALKIGSYRQ